MAHALAGMHGYHALLKMQNPNGKDCVRCHLEHNGENFHPIRWEPSREKFDHELTGYVLEGKHASIACEKCHTPEHMIPADRSLIQMKDLAKSYFGLGPACQTCHSDPHKGRLGNDCATCHNVQSWKTTKEFDHSKTRYPLTGLHGKVACEKCHKPQTPGGPVVYRGLKFQACADCHSDPHRGEFKKACEACHTTSGWKNIAAGFSFDHSKTEYPLVGKHQKVPCAGCHVNGDFKKKIAFAQCNDCHKPDPHNGQFAARPRKGECADCHTLDGWKPSLFDAKAHATSAYPLRGKHTQVECAKCHTPAGKDTIYKVKFGACTDCHKDAHDNQFASEPYFNKCEPCHTVVDFHRSTYTVTQHRNTRFPLTGAHSAVACTDCHKPGADGASPKIIGFKFEDRSCTACHNDPHHGEFNDRMVRKRADGIAFGCEACHNIRSWAEINSFDHSKTKFPLIGAHRTVTCSECHKATTSYESRFKGTPQQCEVCHIDAHDAQFVAKDNKTHCADCHNEKAWVPSTFDHNARTHLPLTGGHARVPCNDCHTQSKLIEDRIVTIYKNTPNKCADCHGSDRSIMPEQKGN